ncbi:MAG: hypothetical protein ACPLYF_02185, partial [Fervidobacterium sp.]
LRIDGPRRKECDYLPKPVDDRLPGCGKKIESGRELEWESEIGIIGLYNIGKFWIWVEYDPSRINSFFGGKDALTNCNFYDKPIKSNVEEFEFVKPSGIDLEVYEKYHNSCNQITLNEGDLLQKYPTSTYAGYVLLKYGPSGSLKDASKITPEKFDERFYIIGNTDEKERRRKETKDKYEDFILKARKYLAVHPDFPKASLLKKEIVNALFYTDKGEEAWKEMGELSRMEGEWAEEAKAVLAEKSAKREVFEEKKDEKRNEKE